jgi:uncharacterized membrane protein
VNQHDFLNALRLELEKVPHVDKEGIIAHHQEFFRIGLEQGQTEEEIAANLGSPQAIAGYYEAHHMIGLAELESSLRNLFSAISIRPLDSVNIVFYNILQITARIL